MSSDIEEALAVYLRLFAPSLPPPQREHRFCKRRWRLDFAWPDVKVAVEADGGQWAARGGRHARDSDREKLNMAARLGWRVLRYSREMLNADPQQCVTEIAETVGGGT